MSSLFRPEVLEAKSESWLGSISLAQPLPLWVMTSFAALAALLIALFLVFGSYTRRVVVTGRIVPVKGLITVLAPASGIITRLGNAEGEQVRVGQVLAVVDVPRVTVGEGDAIDAVQARLTQRRQGLEDERRAKGQLLDAQADGLAAQLSAARRELTQLKREIVTREKLTRIAEETLQRQRKLLPSGYVSVLQVKQQESAWLQAVGEVQAMRRQVSVARQNLAQLQQARQQLPAQRLASDAGYLRDLAAIGQEKIETEARGALAITAPVTGLVATQLVKPGQAVQAGQPMLSLLPGDGKLEAELLAPSRAVGFMKPGDDVLLRYQAYPYQKFGQQHGSVVSVSRGALSQSELQTLLGGSVQSEPMYRVTVKLARQAITAYGKPELLKPGMALEADVLGERRRLIEWAFEPLYSLQGKVGGD